MIRVRVELVPFGNEDQVQEIGQMVLANTGTEGLGFAHYHAVFQTGKQDLQACTNVLHQRQDGFWELIRALIEEKAGQDIDDEIVQQLITKLK